MQTVTINDNHVLLYVCVLMEKKIVFNYIQCHSNHSTTLVSFRHPAQILQAKPRFCANLRRPGLTILPAQKEARDLYLGIQFSLQHFDSKVGGVVLHIYPTFQPPTQPPTQPTNNPTNQPTTVPTEWIDMWTGCMNSRRMRSWWSVFLHISDSIVENRSSISFRNALQQLLS